jgi:AcrR family transcriptional regulator
LKSHTPKGQLARANILSAAEALFVTDGFHGASMRDIAAGAELPLATIVYHFARKEQLYGALLQEIADELVAELERSGDFVETLVRWGQTRPGRVKLLLRELLDNPVRVKKAAQLPLGPFLERAATMTGGGELGVLHVVGAISYVVAAWPTVERIVGADRARKLQTGYEREAIAFARRALGEDHGSRPASPARSSRARAPRARDHG